MLLYYTTILNRITYLVSLLFLVLQCDPSQCKYTAIKHQHFPFCLSDNNTPGLKSVNPVNHPAHCLAWAESQEFKLVFFFASAADGLYQWKQTAADLSLTPGRIQRNLIQSLQSPASETLLKVCTDAYYIISWVGHGFARSFLRHSKLWPNIIYWEDLFFNFKLVISVVVYKHSVHGLL